MASPASHRADVSARHPLRRIGRSFGFAAEGVLTVIRTQPNFWVHLCAAVVVVGLGLLLRVSLTDWAILVLTIAFVLVTEAINTAVEAICDLVSPGVRPLIKQAKDVSAAGVLIAAVSAVLVGTLVFGPRVLALMT